MRGKPQAESINDQIQGNELAYHIGRTRLDEPLELWQALSESDILNLGPRITHIQSNLFFV